VRRFNELDASREHAWIMTIEREDIGEALLGLVELCGFEDSEEWRAGVVSRRRGT